MADQNKGDDGWKLLLWFFATVTFIMGCADLSIRIGDWWQGF